MHVWLFCTSPSFCGTPSDVRLSTGADNHCRPSGSGATISIYRLQALSDQAGGGFRSSKNFRSLEDIAPSLPCQRLSSNITGVRGHFCWCMRQWHVHFRLLFCNCFVGSGALHASQLPPLMELEVVELVFVELVGSELALPGALVSRRRRTACIVIFETSFSVFT